MNGNTMTRGNLIRETDMRCKKGQCFSSVLESVSTRFCHPIIDVTRHISTPADHLATATDSAVLTPEKTSGGSLLSERDRLIEAMEQCGWVQAKAARQLNLTPRQISYALKKHHIDVRRF